jgi:putative ABC transport system permease protein
MRPSGMRRLFRFGSRSAREVRDDVRDEFRFHLEMRTTDLEAEGLDGDTARAQALQEFGDLDRASSALIKADGRLNRQRGLSRLLAELRQDVSYGFRLIVRNRAFSATAVLTLALAIGGNVALFSIVNALFLQPLPIADPATVARIYTGESRVSWLNLEDIRQRNVVLSDVIAQRDTALAMAGDPLPTQITAGVVSTNYFTTLGVVPLAGRPFQPGESRADIVLLSERMWRSRFEGDAGVVGRTLALDGRAFEIIGVMPRRFHSIAPLGFSPDLWIPADNHGAHAGIAADRGAARFDAFARLKPGVTMEQAQASLRVLGAQMAAEHPETNSRFAATEVFPAGGLNLYRGVGKTLLPVFVFVGFATLLGVLVLFMSCANLAGLLLGRAAARRQEIAVRLALGAARGRLVRQLLTESLVLATIGGTCGLLVSAWLTRGLSLLTAQLPFPIALNLSPDRRVLAYTLVVSAVCAIFFGLVPARRASRLQLTDVLRIDTGDGTRRQRFRQALIVMQVAASALLIFWSGLFSRSLVEAASVDPGFDVSDVLLVEVPLSDDRPGSAAKAAAAFLELGQRVPTFAGVQRAGWSSVVPLAMTSNEKFRVNRTDAPPEERGQFVYANRLGPGWFGALRIPIVAGRDFTWQDRAGSPPVVIVNEKLARQLWNGAALSQVLRFHAKTAEVVGVVGDTKYWTIGEAITPQVYLPYRQEPQTFPQTLHVRTSDARATAEQLRSEVQTLVPGAVPRIRPMRDAVAVAVLPARIAAIVTGAFGLIGAALATLGVYGLIAYIVVQRSREVAIRRAVGAQTRHILGTVGGSSLKLTMVGLGIGLAAGSLSAPLLGGLLVNTSPRDPLAFAGTVAVVVVTAGVACLRPTLHAMRLEPLSALKAE